VGEEFGEEYKCNKNNDLGGFLQTLLPFAPSRIGEKQRNEDIAK
tara:strand:+ start:23 stop:154 length:132 start_codon:yes stop_codon:yes gene_type:complete